MIIFQKIFLTQYFLMILLTVISLNAYTNTETEIAPTAPVEAIEPEIEIKGDYLERPELEALIKKLEHNPNLSRERILQLFSSVKQQQSILDAISKPAERTKTWAEYRPIFVTEKRVEGGVEFWKKHQETIDRAAQTFQVPPEIIVAIIGVETRYGQHAGRHRVIDALATLGFDYPPRGEFFYKQLEQFLLLEDYAGINLETTMGSYAGAMGYGQFIPSSYRHYAVDFNNDGKIDIINDPVDAIGSVANYFHKHGWQAGKPIAGRAYISTKTENKNNPIKNLDSMIDLPELAPKYKIKDFKHAGLITNEHFDENKKASAYKLQGLEGEELWLCLENFYVITRYNHSRLYAMSVFQLSQKIKAEMLFGKAH